MPAEVPTVVPDPLAGLSDAHIAGNPPPDLARVLATWDQQPQAIKNAILALLGAGGVDG